MTVELRQVGNSRTLTVPSGIKVTGKEYTVKNASKTIIFTPIAKKKNIFTTKDWNYQKDIENDPAFQLVKQVGREVID